MRRASSSTASLYVGSGIQSICLGFLVERGGWQWLPVFVVPFALVGFLFALKIWNNLPDATKKYNADDKRLKQGLTLPEIPLP